MTQASTHSSTKPGRIHLTPSESSISWLEFLQSAAPGKRARVEGAICRPDAPAISTGSFEDDDVWQVLTPRIRCYCTSEHCDGYRFFSCAKQIKTEEPGGHSAVLDYRCRNCGKGDKHIAVRFIAKNDLFADVVKIGEYPSFGPPTPRNILNRLGDEAGTFLKGRQCENQGQGIGAFAYYRRVVENHKGKLIQQISLLAEKEHCSPDLLLELKEAAKETRFTAAVDRIKVGIPRSLFIKDHNPLTLLHDALSQGLHAETDEECLELAEAIRRILVELSGRIAELLKEDEKLTVAVGKLLKRK
jgi:hypothetical protein